MKKVIFTIIATFVALVLINLALNEPLSSEYITFWYLVALSFLITGVIGLVLGFIREKESYLCFGIAGTLFVVVTAINSDFATSDRLAKMLKSEEVKKESLIFDRHRAVTKAMAFKMANKIIGKKYNGVQISSQYEINRNMSSIQLVRNELVWVMPLDYSGFSKWLKQDSIPGYIIVSATNPTAVPELKVGEKYEMKYSDNAYFMENVERRVYFKTGLKETETHFEIDNQGKPWFISLVLEPTIVFSGKKTSSVIITDPKTGKMKEISFEDILNNPKYQWIDRLQSENQIDRQIHWYGKYLEGFWNTWFGGENINKPTNYNGRELWIAHVNGRQVFFTGMTSENNKDQSLVQGITVDTRTGEAKSFDLSGVMDEAGAISVLDAALGVNSTKWQPVLPQPVIKNGVFYWGASIVSNNNIYQMIGVVNGENQAETFFGKTFKEATAKIGSTKSVEGEEEYVKVKKSVYLKILQHIEALEELKKQF